MRTTLSQLYLGKPTDLLMVVLTVMTVMTMVVVSRRKDRRAEQQEQ